MRPRMTELRKSILNTIEFAPSPVSARWVLSRISEEPNSSTVYRALDYLESHELVQSVSFSRVKFYFIGKEKGCGHFIFCKNCNEIQMFDNCLVRSYEKKIQKDYNYEITGHVLFFEGFCAECRAVIRKIEQHS